MSSSELYKQAYDLHYGDGDLEAAGAAYQQVIDAYPTSPEANYAKTQLQNIEKAKHPPKLDVSKLLPDGVEARLAVEFACLKCDGTRCSAKGLAMPSAGAGRLLDIQNNFYLALTCVACGLTQFYDLNLLEGRGGLGNAIVDALVGA